MLAGMRLLATDLDGTLVFHHAVGQADAEALVRWREAGNLLVLATGRSVRLVQHAVEVARASTSIGLDYDYAVCATGTTVIDAAGRVHCTRTLSADQVRAVTRAVGLISRAQVSVFASTLAVMIIMPILAPLIRAMGLSESQGGWMISIGSIVMAVTGAWWGAKSMRNRAVLRRGKLP